MRPAKETARLELEISHLEADLPHLEKILLEAQQHQAAGHSGYQALVGLTERMLRVKRDKLAALRLELEKGDTEYDYD